MSMAKPAFSLGVNLNRGNLWAVLRKTAELERQRAEEEMRKEAAEHLARDEDLGRVRGADHVRRSYTCVSLVSLACLFACVPTMTLCLVCLCPSVCVYATGQSNSRCRSPA